MKHQHTPGPWVNDGGEISVRILPKRRLPKRAGSSQQVRMHIACVYNAPEPHMLPGEHDANVRLIAAAPELAATLAAVADYWAGGDAPAELEDRIRAALKAAGVAA